MNATEDCIHISDSDNEDETGANESSVLVIGEVPVKQSSQLCDNSIVDLTNGNDHSYLHNLDPQSSSPPPPPTPLSPHFNDPLDSPSPQPIKVALTSSLSSQPLRESSESPLFTPPSSPESFSSALLSQGLSAGSDFPSSSVDSSLRHSGASSLGGLSCRRKKVSPSKKRSPDTDQHQSPARKRCSTRAQVTPKQLDKKLAREDAKRLKEAQAIQRQADKANGVGKFLQNCTAIIDKSAAEIIDPEGYTIRTLFDEASALYRMDDCTKYESSITWSYRRTEAKGLNLVETHKDADWTLFVMDGADYLRRILLYRDDPDNCESIKNFICDTMTCSGVNFMLLVYNLSKSLKEAKRQDEKQFRQNFRNTYESNRPGTTSGVDKRDGTTEGAASIGLTDLQDLRLDLELEIKFEHPNWKLQIDFEEKREDAIAAIVRYTKSVAKLEIERRKTEQTDFDWAINADKERAIDPLKDLTKLWEKQLLQFAQLTTPIAKAITSEYPSPATLIDQYKHLTPEEGENLLAELHIGRLRKQVGPTISRRIYRFMTTRDPKVHLGID